MSPRLSDSRRQRHQRRRRRREEVEAQRERRAEERLLCWLGRRGKREFEFEARGLSLTFVFDDVVEVDEDGHLMRPAEEVGSYVLGGN
jgi:hypothetical protein